MGDRIDIVVAGCKDKADLQSIGADDGGVVLTGDGRLRAIVGLDNSGGR